MRRPTHPRAHVRFRVSVGVTRYDGEVEEWQAHNLSEAGVFVATPTLLESGTAVKIGLTLESSDGPVEIVAGAEVRWANTPDAAAYNPELPAGMGLEFTDLAGHDRATLSGFLAQSDVATGLDRTSAVVPELPPLPAEEATVEEVLDLVASDLPELPPLPPERPRQVVAEPPEEGLLLETLSQVETLETLEALEELAPEPVQTVLTDEAKTHLLAAGTLLGAYRILGVVGQGGMGTVYLAQHERAGHEVALKRLHPKYTNDVDATRRFFDEARLVAQIRHDHIAAVTDFVAEGADRYFVMELLNGQTLAEAIASHGTLPAARAVHIALQLADVLQAVHDQGIIHRDLKPENILLVERNGDPDFVKLLDFGIAKLRESADQPEARRTATGLVVGTPGYIAPEHVLGATLDHRVDIYAFGVLFFKMVVGRMPYEAEDFDALVIKQATQDAPNPAEQISLPVPPEIEAVIVECLHRRPGMRPESMNDIAERLRASEQALWEPEENDALAAAIAAAAAPQAPSPQRRGGGRVILAAVIIGLAVGGWLLRHRLLGLVSEPAPKSPVAAAPETELPEAAPPTATLPPGPAEPPETETFADDPQSELARAAAELPIEEAEPEPAMDELLRPGKKRSAKLKRRRNRGARRAADTGATQAAYERGIEHLRGRKALLALEELATVVQANPSHAKAYRALGQAYAMLGRNDAAITALEMYLRLKPDAKDAEQVRKFIAGNR